MSYPQVKLRVLPLADTPWIPPPLSAETEPEKVPVLAVTEPQPDQQVKPSVLPLAATPWISPEADPEKVTAAEAVQVPVSTQALVQSS